MLEISNQPVDLSNIIKEIKLLFLSKAEKKNLEINLTLPADFPRLLMLDEIRIKQVIFNLVGNAIKFTHNGYVSIKASFQSDGNYCGRLNIDVEDTGIGIPVSQQEIIFETFRQQSGQSNRLYEGAGLGLAISKRLVEKMNGVISVKSQVGKGSVFSVSLPCSMLESNDALIMDQAETDQSVVFEPAEIMVVDDVSSNIEAVESLLENSGLRVVSAENGEIALEILKFTNPKVILLDLRMPVMNGYEVARKIKEDPDFRNLPVLAYTASVFGSEHGLQSGNFDGFLYKPVNRVALYRELMRFLKFNHIVQKPHKTNLPEVSTDNLPKEIMDKLPEIYEWILLNLYPKWDSIKDQLVLFKIEEFATEIRQMALNYNFEYLILYADKLKEELEMVDLEAIRERLLEFPNIMEKISNLINK